MESFLPELEMLKSDQMLQHFLSGRQREICTAQGAAPDGGGAHVFQGAALRVRRPLHRARVLRRHLAVDQHGGRRRRSRNLARVPVHPGEGKFDIIQVLCVMPFGLIRFIFRPFLGRFQDVSNTPLWKRTQDQFWIPAKILVSNDGLGGRLQ